MNKKVLIVDDQASTRKMLGYYLSNNYDVMLAGSGAEALLMLQANNPDLIITDVLMPEMTGHEFLLKARAMKENMPPVMVLSSVENSNEKIKYFQLGAADYVQKPFNPEELRFRIKNAINKA